MVCMTFVEVPLYPLNGYSATANLIMEHNDNSIVLPGCWTVTLTAIVYSTLWLPSLTLPLFPGSYLPLTVPYLLYCELLFFCRDPGYLPTNSLAVLVGLPQLRITYHHLRTAGGI